MENDCRATDRGWNASGAHPAKAALKQTTLRTDRCAFFFSFFYLFAVVREA